MINMRSFLLRCAPITVGSDPFYSAGKCLNFARSLKFCEQLGCTAEPLNLLTAYVDASMIYGNDDTTAQSIRTFLRGELAISR